MPTLLQRLSTAAHSFRDEIVALRISIQDQTKAIHESTEASKHRHDSPPILRAELQIPETIRTYKKGDDTQREGRELFKIVIQVLTLLFVAAYTVITFCALKQSERALEAQTRPVIGVDGPLEMTNQGPEGVSFDIKLRNYSQSPGMASTSLTFGLTFGGVHAGWFSQYHVCEEAEEPLRKTIDVSKYLETVFPGTDGVITEHATAKYRSGGPDTPRVVLFGCIAYKSIGGSIYHTRVVYQADQSMGTKPGSSKINGFTRKYTDAN
jgi:hypothetical protein